MIYNSREIAMNVLIDINNNGTYSNMSIGKHIDNSIITSQDENFIRELVYGVLENKIYIDYIISKASKIKLKKIHPAIMEILRIGVYQLIFMDRVPSSAAVNESVKLAKRYGHKATTGFANGVLRSISRDIDGFSKINAKHKAEYLSIKYSHPQYMVDIWVDEYGEKFTEDLLINNNKKPLLNIRVNTLKTNKEKLKLSLEEQGFKVEHGMYARDCLVVHNPIRITQIDEFLSGDFTIQDESSMLVSQILNPKENSTVLDVCSAPGGKSTHMAQLMNNKGTIIARDIFEHKIGLIKENIKRLDIDIIKVQLYDALKVDHSLIGKIDYCLVDAPCSGLGLLRRKPDIKWNRSEEDIQELVNLQYKILETSKDYVKKDGVLLYSTCTIVEEENLNIVKRFLENNPSFSLSSIDKEIDNKTNLDTLDKGYIQLFPNVHNTDGFFIAKMVKQR